VPKPDLQPHLRTTYLGFAVHGIVPPLDRTRRDEPARPHHHQARHTLATRLINAGASMAHVKRVLVHVSERMSESYVLIAGSQVEPFLQQVWVTGPGTLRPARWCSLRPSARAAARNLLVDLAAVPTEHGLCTFKPVVGGIAPSVVTATTATTSS
jgi:hypothetical protein